MSRGGGAAIGDGGCKKKRRQWGRHDRGEEKIRIKGRGVKLARACSSNEGNLETNNEREGKKK